jgi:hypothetical protein
LAEQRDDVGFEEVAREGGGLVRAELVLHTGTGRRQACRWVKPDLGLFTCSQNHINHILKCQHFHNFFSHVYVPKLVFRGNFFVSHIKRQISMLHYNYSRDNFVFSHVT